MEMDGMGREWDGWEGMDGRDGEGIPPDSDASSTKETHAL